MNAVDSVNWPVQVFRDRGMTVPAKDSDEIGWMMMGDRPVPAVRILEAGNVWVALNLADRFLRPGGMTAAVA